MEKARLAGGFVAVAAAMVQIAYWTAVAYVVDRDASSCGAWSSGGPGHLIPWPSAPGNLTVITRMAPWDTAVCAAYRSGIFVSIVIAVSAGFGLLVWALFRWWERRRQGLTSASPSL